MTVTTEKAASTEEAAVTADASVEKHEPQHDEEASGAAAGHSAALDGPFNTQQLLRIDEALRAADTETELTFSVYVGPLPAPAREYAERLHDKLADPAHSVLLAVTPNDRALEIVTGSEAGKHVSARDCGLAAQSMTARFSEGDLAGGIVIGLRMLTDYASN